MTTPRLFERPEVTLQKVNLADIEPWDSGGAAAQVSRSVEMFGQLQAPLLYEDDAGKLRVADGARRLDEFRAQGIEIIDAYVIPAEASMAAVHGMALAMHQRSPNPVHEARAIGELQHLGYTEEDIAATFGLKLQTIRKRAKLLHLPLALLAGVEAGSIAVGVAERAANMTTEQQRWATDIYRTSGHLRAADLKEITSAHRNEALASLWTDDELPPPPTQVAHGYARQMRAARVTREQALQAIEEIYAEEATK